jgi:hypothetical protein
LNRAQAFTVADGHVQLQEGFTHVGGGGALLGTWLSALEAVNRHVRPNAYRPAERPRGFRPDSIPGRVMKKVCERHVAGAMPLGMTTAKVAEMFDATEYTPVKAAVSDLVARGYLLPSNAGPERTYKPSQAALMWFDAGAKDDVG